MPKKTTHGKFEYSPDYDEEQELNQRLEEARAFLEKELSDIDSIKDTTFQLVCMFALIDCLAQEQANYPRDFKKTFCDFVLTYQKQCGYMKEVEPVTLYYHIEDEIDEVVKISGFPPEKEISLDDLGYLYAEKVQSVLLKGKSNEILSYIEAKKGSEFAKKIAGEHQLISLIYRMRSKAVHEMSGLGESWHWEDSDIKPTEPYYRNVGRSYVQNGEWVSDNVVELVIPNVFVRSILVDCIEGYLSDCKKFKRFPFANNCLSRKHRLSWYYD